MVDPRIGVLSLQGAVEPHIEKFRTLGVEAVKVRTAFDLACVDALVFPGGESTAMLRLIEKNDLKDPIAEFVRTKPTWGICAGAILLAQTVTRPEQESFSALPIQVERNAYGRQVDSFIAPLEGANDIGFRAEGVFIRAPRIREFDSSSVRVLLTFQGEPVLVESDQAMASTFHPELTDDAAIHRYFVQKCSSSAQ